MAKPITVQFNFRVPENIVELIDKDIEKTGEFRNRSEWTLQAMRYFLEFRTKTIIERQNAFNLSSASSSKTDEEGGGDS